MWAQKYKNLLVIWQKKDKYGHIKKTSNPIWMHYDMEYRSRFSKTRQVLGLGYGLGLRLELSLGFGSE